MVTVVRCKVSVRRAKEGYVKKVLAGMAMVFLLGACGTSDYAEVVKSIEDKKPRDGCVSIELAETGWSQDTLSFVKVCGKPGAEIEEFFHRRTDPE